jgi:4-carboxymuconolactone decarboxylase
MSRSYRRFPRLTAKKLTPQQRKLAQGLLAGPRGAGDTGPRAVDHMLGRGPFNAWMRSPDLGAHLQKAGEYIRFHTSVPKRLNEFAILITARYWTSQFEWFAHLPMAVKAGLDPRLAADLALKRRPRKMKPDEAAVYEFCTQLHRKKQVTDAAYKRVLKFLGEQGVMDLIGACGYYTAVSMTLNVAEAPLPAGEKNPLK